MVQHLIFVTSSYSEGTRIGLHRIVSSSKTDDFAKLITSIRSKTNRADYGIHFLETESESWESVIKMDSFFSDVKVYNTEREFIKIVNKDKDILISDVAKLILSRKELCMKSLSMVIEKSSSDYYRKTKKKLFIGDTKLGYAEFTRIQKLKIKNTVLFSRFLHAEGGSEKMNFILDNLKSLVV
nr:hypothetical protein [uncultured Peptostreptococcus sp.]